MSEHDEDTIRDAVRDRYGSIAREGSQGCGCGPTCGESPISAALGYSDEELYAAPDGADLGLGCGNPHAIAGLAAGETVLDLGSGAGFDCFLAGKQVGPTGRVIGVDMTPDMVSRARAIAKEDGVTNVEFRLGEIEHLPGANAAVDAILSNCVVNLSPDKPAVYRDAFRALKSGGRIAISDVVALAPLPASVQSDLDAIAGCVAGAATVDDIEGMLHEAGFRDIRIRIEEKSRKFIQDWLPGSGLEDHVASAKIEAVKPRP